MSILSTNFYDLVEHTCSAIQAFEKRKNKRSEREQEGFEVAVKYILELLWKSHQSYPYRLPKIKKSGEQCLTKKKLEKMWRRYHDGI